MTDVFWYQNDFIGPDDDGHDNQEFLEEVQAVYPEEYKKYFGNTKASTQQKRYKRGSIGREFAKYDDKRAVTAAERAEQEYKRQAEQRRQVMEFLQHKGLYTVTEKANAVAVRDLKEQPAEEIPLPPPVMKPGQSVDDYLKGLDI